MPKFPLLFQPSRIGRMPLRNRLIMAPIGTNLADVNGAVSSRLIDWYAERAWGGVGLVIVENTLVDIRFGRGLAHHLRIDDPRFTSGLNHLVEAVKAAGARIAVQINIQGAGVDPELVPETQPVGPSAISYAFGGSESGTLPPRLQKVKLLRALTPDEIRSLRDAFVRGAGIAKSAGFDAIEIHGAHGYLLAGFMSPASNRRTDDYGGKLEGRLKFVLDICEGIREEVGSDYPVLFRMSGREHIDGGRDIEESQLIARYLARAGVSALHISAGITMQADAYTWMNPPMSFPQGAFIDDAYAIKRVVEIPVIGVGKIRDPAFAEGLLAAGKVDFIALGRTLVADPKWPQKAATGREREIRRCISCNRCVRILSRKEIRCTINARAGQERNFPMTPAARALRVAVVGGGPAGMEAARTAAQLGHKVTLFEKESSLGGQLKLAVVPPYKRDLAKLLSYLKRQAKTGAEVRLNTEINQADLLNEAFDAAIIATGCIPSQWSSRRDRLVSGAWDVLGGRQRLSGKRVVVLGRGRVACEIAELLAKKRGKTVTILHPGPLDAFACDLEPIFERRLLLRRLRDYGVTVHHQTALKCITVEGVHTKGRTAEIIPCDHVINEESLVTKDVHVEALQGKMKVLKAGDCLGSRDLYHAIHEGFLAAFMLSRI
jgi:2,4-dienoyl-CoA reductase-like NADH-dependent reductase (Old Yellow Enzyme family)/thioredoxin reductase